MFKRILLAFALPACSLMAKELSFNKDIRPILSDKCYFCHGPDATDIKGKLQLHTFEKATSERIYKSRSGKTRTLEPAIIPGDLENSIVWERIITDDEDDVMPPLKSHKHLTDSEKQLIKRWIEAGAKYDTHWSFKELTKPALLKASKQWSNQAIDQFVLKKLEDEQTEPAQLASKRQLIRRVSFDITGLPPTLDEIQNFLNDKSEKAYENLVDRLIATPQYGEHMTKYWLDLVRFADTNGMHKDFFRNMSTYRDWVIRSFNANLGYNDFIKYQLAGDLFPNATNDQLIASGFNRLHLIIDKGTALPEESFSKNVIDRVTAVSTAFMGLTMQCARCHDHKFDPITQKDFYAMAAFFNNIDATPETMSGNGPVNGLQQPYILLTNETNKKKFADFNRSFPQLLKNKKHLEKQIKRIKDQNQKAKIQKELKATNLKINQCNTFFKSLPAAMVMKERKEARPSHLLERGAYDAPGELVARNTPEFLPKLKGEQLKTRMDLAEWFVDAKNPLTARVAVNRFWQQFFGTGLSKTSEDFGAQGEAPSHPLLLDYLSSKFIESNWDIKALVKEIVLSKTYQQSSITTTERFKSDPDNRKLARGSRFRMDAEMIRDQILASSGLLSDKMYGPSVKPPQPDGLWRAVSMTKERFKPSQGQDIYRRSVYTYWKRAMAPPQMTILNAPPRESCIARRERTNTPLQALLLLNEAEYMKAARQLAIESLAKKQLSDNEKINFAYERICSKLIKADELAVLKVLIADTVELYRANPQFASDMCEGITLKSLDQKIELAAWTMMINTIYNLDITKTRE